MNMLDNDGENVHTTRESYSYLRNIDFSAVEHAVSAMPSALDGDEQHAAVAKFIQHELDESQEKVTLLHQQGSQQEDMLIE